VELSMLNTLRGIKLLFNSFLRYDKHLSPFYIGVPPPEGVNTVADLGEGPRGPVPPLLFWVKKITEGRKPSRARKKTGPHLWLKVWICH